MTEKKPGRLRRTDRVERPGPAIIIKSGPDEKGRRRFYEALGD